MLPLNASKRGLITGMLMIAIILLFYYGLKYPLNGNEQYLIYSVYVAGIVWSLWAYMRSQEGTPTFKEYFSTGFRTFIVVTLLMVLFTFIFFSFDTAYRESGIAANNKLLLAEGNHTPAEIESNAQQLRKIFMPMMLGITTFKYLILGALITAVGAGFLSQRKQ
ncbi:MAG TPA: DUF4199 domain-containing protein [Ferruginibacter sp.]|nr:DUF4199 domain-containing protein [Chitinophagaceae bacterium]HRI25365.1 DUF4199 domain-containing protein [Ferruginibacter sp.]